MENTMTEIMTNDEVVENVGEVAEATPKKGVGVAVGIGVAVLAGIAIYKIGKKIYTKVKAAKQERERELVEAEYEEIVEDEVEA